MAKWINYAKEVRSEGNNVRDGAREVQLVTAMSKQVGAMVSQRLTLTGGKVEAVGCWAGRAQKMQVADGAAVGIRITA